MKLVTYTSDGGIGRVTMNRPDRLNAMNQELMGALTRAVERAAADDSVRVVVVSGNGRAFSVGGDLSEGAGGGVSAGELGPAAAQMRENMRAAQLLAEMPKISIAEIDGACAGAALALACACDLRYASGTALFTTAFLTAGLPGDYGGTWTLSRVVGPARAREMYLVPQRLMASEALSVGLVHAVIEPEDLGQHVEAVAQQLLGSAPLALRAMKRNLNDALTLGFSELLDVEAIRQIECARTDDAAEAAQAFIEKRPPTFAGR